MLFCAGTVCCVGYLILGCLLRRRPDLKDKNRFLISLAFSDLLIVCHTFSSAFAAFYGKWPFGDSGCKVRNLNKAIGKLLSGVHLKWEA